MSSLHTTDKLFFDILSAANSIKEFTSGLDKNSFLENEMIQSACERKFEIIGEALNRLKRNCPEISDNISDLKRIIGFRNIIAHGYDIIDSEIVWDAIQSCIPKLIEDIKKLSSI